MWGLQSSHVDSHRSMNVEFHAGHWISLSCTVVQCVVPHSTHGAVSLLQGCPHPSHLTFPQSHCSQYDRRLPLSGSQDVQWVPMKMGQSRLFRIHFFAGVGARPPPTCISDTSLSGMSSKGRPAAFFASASTSWFLLMSVFCCWVCAERIC